ncbi:cyclin B [Monosiga brevicollis MX1]|uniref:Cyclin B n=1 Tax=Monosiga brevicollis TaxID=81824 RepID=A9V037_MONBE|nr:cyclin B [Monosiga brevicollis MX1]EDQ89090.1 cyclin B [Monosiga brevicollis MX1]|eukprot:XP_001746195.1 cyclin B [Monosiga brevicollis MX1]
MPAKTFGQAQHVKRAPLGDIGNNAAALGLNQAKKVKSQERAGPMTRAAARNASSEPMPADDQAMETQDETMHDIRMPTLDGPAPALALPAGVENIDEEDTENPQMATEYVADIYNYMREMEVRLCCDPAYLQSQPEVNERMRAILIDWLVEVHYRFELLQETLYLTVDVLDRFLSSERTSRSQLQLVGVTAMLIASKYEEMYPPEVGDFVYISDNAYRREQILAMEQTMLRVLDFNLGKPLPLHFLRRDSRAGHADGTMHTFAKYFMELTLCSPRFLGYKPSQVAAAATYISREVVGEQQLWTPTIEFFADYTLTDIMPVILDMKAILRESPTAKQQAVRTKFSRSKYMRISREPMLEKYISEL